MRLPAAEGTEVRFQLGKESEVVMTSHRAWYACLAGAALLTWVVPANGSPLLPVGALHGDEIANQLTDVTQVRTRSRWVRTGKMCPPGAKPWVVFRCPESNTGRCRCVPPGAGKKTGKKKRRH